MTNDVFGEAVWDYYRDEVEGEVRHERDDGQKSDAHIGLYFSGHEEWNELTKEAINHAEGKVLDAGCGAGRHSLHLQSQGLDVYAVDSSRLSVKTASERGVENSGVMDIQRLGFRENTFDTALVIGHHLGVGGTRRDLLKNLKELSRVVSSGGKLVADMLDPSATDEDEHLEYHERNREKGRHIGYTKFRVIYDGMEGDWVELLRVGSDELTEIVENTSWEVDEIHGEDSYVVVLENS